MSSLITFIIAFALILTGKKLFGKWFNHLSIFVFSWSLFIILYELKLMRYIDIKDETWVIIIASSLCLVLGIITILTARYTFNKTNNSFINKEVFTSNIFLNNGKVLEITLLIFTTIGLLTAIQHWMVLINEFGSIPAVLIRANLIYRMRVEGEIVGTIPYLNAFSYAAVFIAGVLTAYKGKLKFRYAIPLIAVILQDMASVGRAGIFLAFLEFTITFFLFRHTLSNEKTVYSLSKKNFIVAIIVILILFIGSTTLIKTARGSIEKFKASTPTLNELEKSSIITPSIYLYFSSNIGVLSRYFEEGGEDKMFGENTFLLVYNLISKFGVIEHPGFYPKGYFIPMWTNSSTYIRDIHEDFGFFGILFVPYLLGIITTIYWFKFYENKRMIDFIILSYLYLIIAFSTFYMITRSAVWWLSFFILSVTFWFVKRNFSSAEIK